MLTLAPSTITPAPLTSMATALPSTVFALVFLPVDSLAITLPGTT